MILNDNKKRETYQNPSILVVSGDLTQKGSKEEYDDALKLINEINNILTDPKKNRIVVVPGNHDYDKKISESIFVPKTTKPDALDNNFCIPKEDIYICVDEDKYSKRLEIFNKFYFDLYKRNYHNKVDYQFDYWFFDEFNLEILGLNSAAYIDHLRKRGRIEEKAIINASKKAGNKKEDFLRLAVWHHDYNSECLNEKEDALDPDILF